MVAQFPVHSQLAVYHDPLLGLIGSHTDKLLNRLSKHEVVIGLSWPNLCLNVIGASVS
jgi:hypothetical protein